MPLATFRAGSFAAHHFRAYTFRGLLEQTQEETTIGRWPDGRAEAPSLALRRPEIERLPEAPKLPEIPTPDFSDLAYEPDRLTAFEIQHSARLHRAALSTGSILRALAIDPIGTVRLRAREVLSMRRLASARIETVAALRARGLELLPEPALRALALSGDPQVHAALLRVLRAPERLRAPARDEISDDDLIALAVAIALAYEDA